MTPETPTSETTTPDDDTVTLFHCPQTRSSGSVSLLEELGAPYKLHIMNMKAGENRQPAYLAINPLGKVPAIRHRGALITEQVAIYLYLADQFPKAGLAPAIGDPLRGPYLRWMVYYAACYEPGLIDRALNRDPGAQAMSTYGDFDVMLQTVVDQITDRPYLLGDAISAADLLWGQALNWGMMFQIVPQNPVTKAYVDRVMSRPCVAKVTAIDAERAAEHAAAAA